MVSDEYNLTVTEGPESYKLSVSDGNSHTLSVTDGVQLQVTLNAGAQGPAGPAGPAGVGGGNYTGAYDIGAAYAVGDIATYDGELWYRTNSNGGNVGDTPVDGSPYWDLLAAKGEDGADALFNYMGDYNSQTGYIIGDVVTYAGETYYRTHYSGISGEVPYYGSESWDLLAAAGGENITLNTNTNLTGFISGNGSKVSGATIGSTTNAANSIVIRTAAGLVQCSNLRLSGSGYNSDINTNPTQTNNRTYTLPDSSGTVALNTTAVMLTGNQLSIGGNKTFNGQLEAILQFALTNDSLMTRYLCDSRYDRKFYAISVNAVSASSTTPVEICNTSPLESGTYRIEAYVASIHSATAGTVIGLISDQNIAIQFLDQYGRPNQAMSATPISSDSTMSSTRSDLGGVEFYRRIEGVCYVPVNTVISLTIAQSVNNAIATTTRKRSYLNLQKLY
jgi:hypothetical protein